MTTNVELIEKIFTLSRIMKERMSYSSGLMKLSLLQIQTLIFLQKRHNAQMSDIAQFFNIEMPTATNLIAKLVRQELLNRERDKHDRRLVRIVLTTKGKTLLSHAMKERSNKITKLLAYLSMQEKKQLLAIISLLIAKMEVIHEK